MVERYAHVAPQGLQLAASRLDSLLQSRRTSLAHSTVALMANTKPTPMSFFRAVHTVSLLLFKPKRFLEIQAENNALINSMASTAREDAALVLRRAFFSSFLLVLGSAGVGYSGGLVFGMAYGCVGASTIVWLQIVGTSVLLWGTLFIRGWDIQTIGGVSLTERANQWIYRCMYCVGTAVLVASVSVSTCK